MRGKIKVTIGIILFMILVVKLMVYAGPITVLLAKESPNQVVEADFQEEIEEIVIEDGEMRGLWVATVLNIDYPSKTTPDPSILKSEAIKILDHAEFMGLNAVFLQVRPTSDAIYPSSYFPWSRYLTGEQGLKPNDDFDPLGFWIEEAHKRGIELHAWINPYRITRKTAKEPSHDFASLSPTHPARLNPKWVVKHSDGNLYFDPGIPEVRKLIIDSALEIIESYDIDGIHFDDYFYPGKDFNDKSSYEKYGKSYEDIHDWRRENVNLLIGDLSKAIKDTGKDVSFGISPFGIWANKATNELGSDTRGMQSYYDQYADTRKWVKEGMIDYIAPQLYWNIGFDVADYSKLLDWWVDVVNGTEVDLYIGQGVYKAGNLDPSSPWYGVSEIGRQLKLNQEYPEVKGSIYFNYKSLANMPPLSAVIKAIYEAKDGDEIDIPVSISRPSANIKTEFTQYYINGASNPSKPLLVNGKVVEAISSQGYYGVLVPLDKGDNIIVVSQGGSYETRIINRQVKSNELKKMSTAEIPTASVFPQVQELRSPGEKITLQCQAPIGSKVTVTIGGKTYNMSPSTTKTPDSGIYVGTFTYVYTIPSYSKTPRNIDLGAPVYTMNYKGTVKTKNSPAKIGVIMKNSPYYAEVNKEIAYTYKSPSTSNGATFELYKGMQDYVTAMTGNYVRLSNNQWISKNDVRVFAGKSQLKATVKKAQYSIEEKWDKLKLNTSQPVAATVSFNGKALELQLLATTSGVLPQLPQNSLISSVDYIALDNKVKYTLNLKDTDKIEGYYIEKTDEGIVLNIKRPVKATPGFTPLTGITIMLDPGHGGKDPGALGPLGPKYAEKAICLDLGLKLKNELEALGATVLMTRAIDIDLTLDERLAASRGARPDMFISIHANSMNDNVDISKVDGFSIFYRDKHSQPLAQSILNTTIETLKRSNKGIHEKNFYVTRGTWTPSVLIESGFVPNPTEFQWLMDEQEQIKLARAIAEGIVKYLIR